MSSVSASSKNPALRDPAWSMRVFWFLAAIVLVWPMFQLTEFRPWILLDEDNLRPH